MLQTDWSFGGYFGCKLSVYERDAILLFMKLNYITCNLLYLALKNPTFLQQVSERDIAAVEERTRGQASSKLWFAERQWRMTASRFGEICKATHRRNKVKLCQSLVAPQRFNNKALVHGKTFERRAVEKFENLMHLKVKPCGLFVCDSRPYLGASPDGLIGKDSLIEVKCPYNGRNEKIVAGKCFKFLTVDDDNKIVLRQNSDYYFQIQGQLYISQRHYCYFVVFTFKDFFVQKIEFDRKYCEGSLLPKLDLFYTNHFRPYLSSTF